MGNIFHRGDTERRSLPGSIVLATLMAFVGTASWAEDPLDKLIDDINEAAQVARDAGDFEVVEQKRRDRWELIAKHIDGGKEADSPWATAYRVIQEVDGAEFMDVDDLNSVGLVNELKYKEACDKLQAVFKKVAGEGKGPLLGEVAVRYFEVAQQAKGVYRDALEEGSRNRVASVDDIADALKTAIARDPCCVVATPMLQYMQQPDSKEAFLRAEVRADFRERQHQLVNINHPLVLTGTGAPQNQGKSPEEQEKERAKEIARSRADVAVMPWHAAVELDKARNLAWLLRDLDYTQSLTPDFIHETDGEVNYVVPGAIFAGHDALMQPFQLLYGQILLARTTDESGRLRSAGYFLRERQTTAKQTKTNPWDHRFVELLWRVPSDEELANDAGLRRKQDIVGVLAFRKRWKLGDDTFLIYDFPIRETDKLIQNAAQILCVRDITVFDKMKFVPLNNRPDALSKIEPPEQRLDDMPFSTTPRVSRRMAAIEQKNDPTKHPLAELLKDPLLNPLVIISERDLKDKAPSEPQFFKAANAVDSPYLMLDDGLKLHVAVTGREESPCCWIEFDGATAYMPLLPRAIPKGILLGSTIGRAFVGLLRDAGYTDEEAMGEIQRAMTGKKTYVPAKFQKMINARMKGERQRLQKEKDRFERLLTQTKSYFSWWLYQPTQIPSDADIALMIFSELLSEKGWVGSPSLRYQLESMFHKYGFRYLRDRRGNWILQRSLIDNALDNAPRDANGLVKLPDLPYAFLAQDGKKEVSTSQVYSWPDYEQIKANIYNEHLQKMLFFQPCFPALDVIAADAAASLEHPALRRPDYLNGWIKSSTEKAKKGSTDSAGVYTASGGEEKPMLTAPIALWMVSGDKTAQDTLGNLFTAYLSRLKATANSSRGASVASEWLRLLKGMQVYTDMGEGNEALRKEIDAFDKFIISWYRKAVDDHTKAIEPLLAIQWESGRDYATRKYFHNAIVYYNDLLSQLYPSDDAASRILLLTTVPTTDKAREFIGTLESLIYGQLRIMNAQVELAGVLNAAGLHDSAGFIWQRTRDDFEFFLEPAIRIAEGLLASYGLKVGVKAEQAVEQLEGTVKLCRDAIQRYAPPADWRKIGVAAGGEREKQAAVEVKAVRDLLQKENLGELNEKEAGDLQHSLDAVIRNADAGFRAWLDLKKTLIDLRPALALRTENGLPAWTSSPATYDEDEGFVAAYLDIVTNTSAQDVLDWSRKPLDQANQEAIASTASFLVAWYWSDTNKLPLARAATMNLAKVELARAKADGNTTEGLLHEINAYTALTSAGAIVEALPGLSGFKSDFSSLLIGQLRDWEKRWFALANNGPHASAQSLELQARAWSVKAELSKKSKDWRSDRWFFPDYRYEFGSVPDYLAYLLMNSPELFKTLTQEEVAARGKDAVEGNKWALITVADAKRFFDARKVDDKLKKEIVFLAD
jgi:hypothetical protein